MILIEKMETKKLNPGIPWWKVLFLAVVMIILPQLVVFYLRSDRSETFHRYVDENRSECLERSEKDHFPRQICIEAARQAREAFSATVGETYPELAILLSMNFSTAIALLALSRRVDRLSKGDDA